MIATVVAGSARAPGLLLVEDELLVAMDLQYGLEELGFEVSATAHTGQQALEMAQASHPDLVLMDIRLPGQIDGIATAGMIRDRFDIPVVFLTANSALRRSLAPKMLVPTAS